jgi:metal-sulfur cluster biosynthetic enzyme
MVTEEQVKEKLKTVKDPEIGLDIISLGLVYGVELAADEVKITMTLTSPMCPLGDTLVAEVKKALAELGAAAAEVQLTFDPPWDTSKMSEEAKAELGVL